MAWPVEFYIVTNRQIRHANRYFCHLRNDQAKFDDGNRLFGPYGALVPQCTKAHLYFTFAAAYGAGVYLHDAGIPARVIQVKVANESMGEGNGTTTGYLLALTPAEHTLNGQLKAVQDVKWFDGFSPGGIPRAKSSAWYTFVHTTFGDGYANEIECRSKWPDSQLLWVNTDYSP